LTTLLQGPWGLGLVVAGFLLGSLIAVPVTLLILVSALIYGPALGVLYAMVGSVAMIPGIAAMAVFAEGILALVRDADLKHFLVAGLALVFIVGLTLLARRLFSRMYG
jgi:uncharacterized membrane protein YdjX (TVP38/TMEM64 family)